MIIGALLVGMGLEWFINGIHSTHLLARIIMVGVQIVIGLGIILYS
jgi:hypothetical protein